MLIDYEKEPLRSSRWSIIVGRPRSSSIKTNDLHRERYLDTSIVIDVAATLIRQVEDDSNLKEVIVHNPFTAIDNDTAFSLCSNSIWAVAKNRLGEYRLVMHPIYRSSYTINHDIKYIPVIIALYSKDPVRQLKKLLIHSDTEVREAARNYLSSSYATSYR